MTGGFESLSDSSLRAFALFPDKGLFTVAGVCEFI